MAYYPGHPQDPTTAGRFAQLVWSTESPINIYQVDYASNGTSRVKRKSPSVLREFKVQHILKLAEKNILISFYEANKKEVFDFVFTSSNSECDNCVFTAPPQLEVLVGGYWRVTCSISQLSPSAVWG